MKYRLHSELIVHACLRRTDERHHRCDDLIRFDPLTQVNTGAGKPASQPIERAVAARDHHNLTLAERRFRLQMACYGIAIHLRQIDIEHDQVGQAHTWLDERAHRLDPIGKALHRIALAFQACLNDFADRLGIVDNRNELLRRFWLITYVCVFHLRAYLSISSLRNPIKRATSCIS